MPRGPVSTSMLSALGGLSSDEEAQYDIENVKPRRGRTKATPTSAKLRAAQPRKRKALEESTVQPSAAIDADTSLDSLRMEDNLTSASFSVNIVKKQKTGRSTSKSRAGSTESERPELKGKAAATRKRQAAAEIIQEEDEEEEDTVVPTEQPGKPRNTRKPASRAVKKEAEPSEQPTLLPFSRSTTRLPASSLPIRSPTKFSQPLEDASLRRKLGDTTRKLESLTTKYTTLRDVGVKEAEQNFNALKKSADEQLKAANLLVEGLKAELKTQHVLACQATLFKKEMELKNDKIKILNREKEKVDSELAEQKAENKALAAKLAATRNAASSVRTAQDAPGSAVKSRNGGAGQTVLVGTAEAARAAAVAALKEELYSDLSGLAVLKVEKREYGAAFDCIQTGNQTTLHFKLTVEAQQPNESYQDCQYIYAPRIDEDRDRVLLSLLPDYLTEEISFTRDNAPGFFKAMIIALGKKVPSGLPERDG